MLVSKAVIFVLNQGENTYRAVSTCGLSTEHPVYRDGIKLSDDFPQLLLYTQSKISLRELRVAPFDPWQIGVAITMERLGFDACYPVFSNYQLVGILALGPVASEVRRALGGHLVWDTLIQEAILSLENAILREELLRSQKNLQQIDRLRSVEAMTEGLTQELHSPVMSIKAFVQLAHLRRHDKEFMDTLHRVVGDDLAKIEQLTQEIREYVKPLSEKEYCDVDETIKACLLFFSNNPVYQNIRFDVQYDAPLPLLPVNRQGFMQVMFNALLFLLKDVDHLEQTLHIRAEIDRRATGQCWVIFHFSYKSDQNSQDVTFLTLENDDLTPAVFVSSDGREKRGLLLASQIIQRYSGSLELLTNTPGETFGIRIQIPIPSLNSSQSIISNVPVSAIQVQDN